MTSVETDDGGDPTKAILEGIEAQKEEIVRDAADLWFQESDGWLQDAATRRGELGQSKGRQGRAMHGLASIQQSMQPPQWDDAREAWVWSVTHEGAVFQEFGARPHEIRAKKAEALAFEWPDAPREVQKEFEHTEGDLVFFESIQHPGIPAIGFVRYGRDRASEYLEKEGYDTEEVGDE